MGGVILAWNMFSIVIGLCFVYGFNYGVIAFDSKSESDLHDSFEHPQIWSPLLEQMTINDSSYNRNGRAYNQQYPYKYIPTSNIYITKRIGSVAPLGPAAFKQNINFNGNGANQGVSNNNHHFNNRVPTNTPEVSETDLYLLNAIEKLVYRVDYMERRLHKTEQIVYYLMAGNNQNQKEIQDKIEKPEKPAKPEKSCAMNFTRVGDNCYLFIANKLSNWKTANSVCRSYGAHLAELETLAKNEEVVTYLLNHQQTLNGDFWLGGLNPGLLWIWSTSARPVNPNVNLTQISNSTTHSTGASTLKISPKIYNSKPITITKGSNETGTVIEKKPTDKREKIIVNKMEEMKIDGNGRCLGLRQKTKQNKYPYEMFGFDCSSRQRIICELPHDDIENEIDRIAKKLFS